MRVADFYYDLPPEAIAQKPVEPRDHSRLMVVPRDGGPFLHRRFYDIVDSLRPGDLLVVNETRVIPARLKARRMDTGSPLEVFLLNPKGDKEWEVLVKPGKKARLGQRLTFGDGELSAEVVDHTDFGGRVLRFDFTGNFDEIIDRLGQVPLPPYIEEELAKGEEERYQTVYNKERGSVAAPTAGLHFTPELLKRVTAKGVGIAKVLLHVGLGTFRPVSVERVEDHRMHAEFYQVSDEAAKAINRTRQQGGRVIAVGTTSVRTLESACDAEGRVQAGEGWTDIFIVPGQPIRSIDGLITNFHLPQSTLLMLVAAFVGRERILAAYQEALQQGYRFFSFGDAMLII